MHVVRWKFAALLAGLVALNGCSPLALAPMRSTTSLSDAASLDGLAVGPESLVANNSAGLIANNSAGLIANNSAGFRVAALEPEVPLPRAIIYLTDARDRFFEGADGRPISATTDQEGRYEIPRNVPINQPVIVSLVLSENRREVGFTVPKAGKNTVNVSLATTYVTEFLRHSATLDQRTMAAYPLDKLALLTERTNQAMADGSLPQPTLRIADIASANMTYAIAIGSNLAGLGDAWAEMLGRRVMAVSTVAGTGVKGSSEDGTLATASSFDRPKGLAKDAQGNLYIVAENEHRIRKVLPDGKLLTVAGNGQKHLLGDGASATSASLNGPRAVIFDALDNMIIADTLNMAIRMVPKVPGTYFGISMPQAGHLYTIAGELDPAKFPSLGIYPNGHQDGKNRAALFGGPRGLALDSQGNLYVADSYGWNTTGSYHFIRKIDGSGNVTTILGQVTTPEQMSAGFSPDGTPASQVRLNYPQQLAIDGLDRLYIAEAGSEPKDDPTASTNRIAMIDLRALALDPQTPIRTVAGGGDSEGDGVPAKQARVKQPYGVALGPNGIVYFTERGTERVRAILADGTVRTLAGGGTLAMNGDGPMVKLSQPIDLVVDADGDLLVAESDAHKVRRISTRFGL